MEDDLPTEYDVIVVGTGMTESIVAAAASRIGKKVLHLDSEDHYGGMWASFNFENMLRMVERVNSEPIPQIGVYNFSSHWYLNDNVPTIVGIPENAKLIGEQEPEIAQANKSEADIENECDTAEHNAKPQESSDDNIESSTEKVTDEKPNETVNEKIIAKVDSSDKSEWTRQSLIKEYRKFNIDLAPKLLFARGDLVELLISSNIARYSEFRCVNRVLTWYNETLHPVPCSRADVFATKYVSVVEKRMLMKILTSLMEFEESKSAEYYDKDSVTFLEYLKKKKLPDNVIRYLLYAIAGASDTTLCKEGILRCKKFLTSLGRYGNTPFLWSMYGCGELPQGFCRLCAVYGGIYYLNRPINKIEVTENSESAKRVTVYSNDKELKCEHIVMAIHKAPESFVSSMTFSNGISRAIFIMNSSILPFEKESLTLLQFPPLPGKKNPVTMIELGSSTCSCPNDLYMLHMTCKQTFDAETDLKEYAEKLLSFQECDTIKSRPDNQCSDSWKPKVLWCTYFNMTDTSNVDREDCQQSGVYLCSGPDIELDFDKSIQQAREIFTKIYKDAEFLPRAPDPDEIVFEDNDSDPGPVFEKDVVNSTEQKDEINELENSFQANETEETETIPKTDSESQQI